MKILNLYSGIGGNRRLWDLDHSVTAVESNPVIAKIYQELYLYDEVVVGDAVDYLEKNYNNFDFIWASPPCVTHSVLNFLRKNGWNNQYCKVPDMTLYGIILFLQNYYKGLWVVENVKPFYAPLIRPEACLQRHYFWSNFTITGAHFEKEKIRKKHSTDYEMYDLIKDKRGIDKRTVLKNCVNNELGKYILECAENKYTHFEVRGLL